MGRWGSPPRVRGTAASGQYIVVALGITPACAGNSLAPGFACAAPRDHPRVCGEQPFPGGNIRYPQGSPPRVRGTGVYSLFCRHRKRITPACAGNSSSLMPLASSRRDHPRVCGEQLSTLFVRRGLCGSPPRVRGTERTSGGVHIHRRITPACAGNSVLSMVVLLWLEDHPRVCGEQSSASNI